MGNPFAKTLSGSLMCPHCESHALKFVGDTGPGEKRYQCKNCGGFLRYQYRNKPQTDDKRIYSGHTRGLDLSRVSRLFGRYK